VDVATSPWVGIKWIALGLLALLIGFVWFWVAERQLRLWLCAGYYEAAELEVTRFIGKPRNSQARCWIEGVIHPGGERIVTSDRDVAIKRFIRPGDRTRNEPLPEEIEGQRLTVSYWPGHAAVKRWWHPPTVVSREEIPGGAVVIRDLFLGGAFVGVGFFFCRRGFRYLKAAVSVDRR
jgi:hypothetical protein